MKAPPKSHTPNPQNHKPYITAAQYHTLQSQVAESTQKLSFVSPFENKTSFNYDVSILSPSESSGVSNEDYSDLVQIKKGKF